MIRVESGQVLAVERRRPGVAIVRVQLSTGDAPAMAFEATSGLPVVGDEVLCNTTAVDLGLGTGGVHLVIAIVGRDLAPDLHGHAMKMRYSPLQLAVDSVEESPGLDDARDLAGVPIVVLPLHSLLAPAAIAARALAPQGRTVFVMTDQAALPLAFSDLVATLRERDLLAGTVTTGQSFGGDLEAVTVASGMLAAREVLEADLVIVGMGPGNLGTASRYGFAALEVASVLQFAIGLGAEPVVAPRMSFADPRDRHHGLSHHLVTALGFAPAGWRVALPTMPADLHRGLDLGGLNAAAFVQVDVEEFREPLAQETTLLRSMGRTFGDDPWFFFAGAAASALALAR